MSRTINHRILTNTRLASNYGGWIYCNQCGGNIGNLCYATYDNLQFAYTCNCGNHGSIKLDFDDSQTGKPSASDFITIRNRFCCPEDNEPLITILDQKVSDYDLQVTCKACNHTYHKQKNS